MDWYMGSPEGRHDARNSERYREMTRKAREDKALRERLRPPVDRERLPRPYKADPRSNRSEPQRPRPMKPSDYTNGPVIDNETGKRVPPPKDPFAAAKGAARRYIRDPSRMARVLKPFLRAMSPMDVITFMDWLDILFKQNGLQKHKVPVLNPKYWFLKGVCQAFPVYSLDGWTSAAAFPDGERSSLHMSVGNCLSGQALPAPPVVVGNNTTVIVHGTFTSTNRCTLTRSWWRVRPSVQGRPAGTDTLPGYAWSPDPNFIRRSPGRPQSWQKILRRRHGAGALARKGWADPGPMEIVPDFPDLGWDDIPDSAYTPDSSYVPDSHWSWSNQPGSNPGTGAETSTGTETYIPVPGATRTVTDGPIERKSMSRSRRFMVALFHAIDQVSEAAEIVDALYDALPEDVKKRWSRDRRGLLDTAGQYGIDGADWKLQALYYNWHKVDVEQGLKNIVKNHLADKFIGGYQRLLPRNVGNATSEGDKAFAEFLDDILSQLMEFG